VLALRHFSPRVAPGPAPSLSPRLCSTVSPPVSTVLLNQEIRNPSIPRSQDISYYKSILFLHAFLSAYTNHYKNPAGQLLLKGNILTVPKSSKWFRSQLKSTGWI